eukprot:8675734-Pyramimonas_sp.AAC.1
MAIYKLENRRPRARGSPCVYPVPSSTRETIGAHFPTEVPSATLTSGRNSRCSLVHAWRWRQHYEPGTKYKHRRSSAPTR